MANIKPGETLADLLERLLNERGMTGREVSRQAEAAGHSVSYTTINDLKSGKRRTASAETCDAIASVFGLDRNEVRALANLPLTDNGETGVQLLSLHETLTPEERELALRMYREYVRGIKGLRPKA